MDKMNRQYSKNQHAVAVAEEAVLFLYGDLVGFHHPLAAGEGGHHHEQGGFGQEEGGEDGLNVQELDTWNDRKKTTEPVCNTEFAVRLSRETGKNLIPFFDDWGLPLHLAATERIGSLPVWNPNAR